MHPTAERADTMFQANIALRRAIAVVKRRPWLLLLAFAFLLVAAGLRRHDPSDGKLRLTVLDVGQGDCLFLMTPTGRTMLIDGGGDNDEATAAQSNVGEQTIVPFLHYMGVSHLDVVVLTHPHGDHVGGLSAVLREESVGAVLDGTCLPYPSPAYTSFLDLVHQKHIRYIHAVRGMKLALDKGVTADVLNPPAQGFPYGTNSDNDTVNNYSTVLRIGYGRTHFLLDGDAQSESETAMLAAGSDLSADVLKCGHHGSRNASTDAWLSRVRPRYAAISCGAHNTFGHPSPQTMARLAAHQIPTFITAKNGAITFESDGQTVTAHPYLH